MDVQSLLDALGGGRPVYIQTHDYPDPDAIASAFGMQQFLRHFGVDSTLIYVGDAERVSLATAVRTFGIELVNASQISMAEDDPILLVDGQKLNANMTDLPGDEVACIDHHPIFKDISYRYADIRSVGACSSIVADYFFRAHVPMSEDVSTMLLFGLQIDTSCMTRGVADLDLDVFPRLFRQADKTSLEIVESSSLEFTDLQAFGAAINTIRIFGRTGIAFIPFACPDALIAQVADFILSLAEVDVAIIRARREAGLKFSVRSIDPSVHSGYLLSHVMPPFGKGGGHAGMAGGFVGNEGIAESGLDLKSFMRMLDDGFLRYIAEHQNAGA